MSVAIGIDPGINGAIVIFREGKFSESHVMPIKKVGKKSLIDTKCLASLMKTRTGGAASTLVYLEEIGLRPAGTMGAVSGVTIGRNYGRLETVLECLRLEVRVLRPQKWRSLIGLQKESTPEGRKLQSIRFAEGLGVPLTWGRRVKPHDGVADAACLAWLASSGKL